MTELSTSKQSLDMPTLVSHFYHSNNHAGIRNPIIYLHGSGRSEADGADFLARLSSGRLGFFVRGQYDWHRGYTFIRRNDDHSLDYNEIRNDARKFSNFLKALRTSQTEPAMPPILVGYSSGAIMAAATLWQCPDLIAGAVLFRPQSPDCIPPVLQKGLPVLLISGLWDEQRAPEDASLLEGQLEKAGGKITHLTVDAGHSEAENGSDFEFTRNWLRENFG